MTKLRIQQKTVDARAGESVLDVARRHGFEIPTLCHHELLRPYGACRVCLVEIAKPGRKPQLTTSCNYPALEGIEVTLDTPKVERARKLSLELLLAHAPEATAVIEIAAKYGVEASRFARVQDPVDCILCGLCERVCRDVVGASAISLAGRGSTRRVEPPFDDDGECIGCGACESLCPTGVLRMRESASLRFRRLQGDERLCRYAMMGLLPGALCANDYRCERCETEQAMVERMGYHPLLQVQPAGERERVR